MAKKKLRIPLIHRKTETEKEKEAEAKKEKEQEEKAEKENEEFGMGEMGLDKEANSAGRTISFNRIGPGGGYLETVSVDDILDGYKDVEEYLRLNRGPGVYVATVRKGRRSAAPRQIRIADEAGNVPGSQAGQQQQPYDPSFMSALLQMQTENARLQSEMERLRAESQNSMWQQMAGILSPIFQGMAAKFAGGNEAESGAAAVLQAGLSGLRDLVALQREVIPQAQGNGSNIGNIVAGIGMALEQMGRLRQGSLPPIGQQAPPSPYTPPHSSEVYYAPQLQPQPVPQQIQQPVATPPQPIEAPLPQASPTSAFGGMETPSFEDLYVSMIAGMIEQQQSPKLIATQIEAMLKLAAQDLQTFDPGVRLIFEQMIKNPMLAWDYLVGEIPELKADAAYTAEIRAEVQKIKI